MPYRNIIISLIFTFMSFYFISCAGFNTRSYNEATHNMINEFRSGQLDKAYQSSDQLVTSSEFEQKQDYNLALLERGKIALSKGDFDSAIKDFQEAEKSLLQLEGTFSIEEEVSSLFTNDLDKEYLAEPYELILISPYLAMAYLAKKDLRGARVERNRAINKINRFIEQSGKRELENPFARYIAALIYELEGKNQDAKIEYNKIAKYNSYLTKEMKESISYLEKTDRTELVLFSDVGIAPQKYEQKYGPFTLNLSGKVISATFAYAKVKPVPTAIKSVQVYLDKAPKGDTQLLYNLEKTILEQHKNLEERQLNSIKKRFILRMGAALGLQVAGEKTKGLAGDLMKIGGVLFGMSSIMEQADLRRWSTLPKEIQFVRIRDLKPGDHIVQVGVNGNSAALSPPRKVTLEKGKINILYLAAPQ